MKYRSLGRTGVKVEPAVPRRHDVRGGGQPRSRRLVRIIHAALDAGINFIDTADVYSAGESEEIVGKALKGRRDDVVLATKVHAPMGSDPNSRATRAAGSSAKCENSLRRLDTDHIDLYQIHRPDPATDIDDTLVGALGPRAPGQGAVPGQLDVPGVGDRRGAVGRRATRAASGSCASSRRTRSSCAASRPTVLPTCERYGMGVIPWSPLNGGWLTGKWRHGSDTDTSRRAARMPDRYDLTNPEHQRKLDARPGARDGRRRRRACRSPTSPSASRSRIRR